MTACRNTSRVVIEPCTPTRLCITGADGPASAFLKKNRRLRGSAVDGPVEEGAVGLTFRQSARLPAPEFQPSLASNVDKGASPDRPFLRRQGTSCLYAGSEGDSKTATESKDLPSPYAAFQVGQRKFEDHWPTVRASPFEVDSVEAIQERPCLLAANLLVSSYGGVAGHRG